MSGFFDANGGFLSGPYLQLASALSAGAVVFADSAGRATGDATKLKWDTSDNTLFVGDPTIDSGAAQVVTHFSRGAGNNASIWIGAATNGALELGWTNATSTTYLNTAGAARKLAILQNGTERWSWSTAGHLLAGTDNTYDIGASGATRPRDLHLGRNLVVAGALDHDGSTLGFFGVTPAARAAAYTPTNVTTDRAFDADTVAVAELADVVGTLIADLQAYGLLQ